MRPFRSLSVVPILVVFAIVLLTPAAAEAAFGLSEVSVTALNADHTIDQQSGSHPFSLAVTIVPNLDSETLLPEGGLRSLAVELPPGLVGDPQGIPQCTAAQFNGGQSGYCPGDTQIGVVHVGYIGQNHPEPIYNIAPDYPLPALFGFKLFEFKSLQETSLRTGADYGVTVVTTLPLPLESVREEIWGVPGDSGHDAERICINPVLHTHSEEGCSVPGPHPAFLSLPTTCAGPLSATVSATSLEEPPTVESTAVSALSGSEEPLGLSGCAAPPFAPSITAHPEATIADSPSGLAVDLHIPQSQEPESLATAHLKNAVVTLPQGLAVNPSAAAGLAACSEAQVGFQGSVGGKLRFTPAAAECPDASKLGDVTIETPLLNHPISGSVYLAKQGENPFHSLIALYIAVADPKTGIVVKLPGRVEPDPRTGQLEATFEENPQLPFEDLHVDFFGGPRAPLTSPPTCGSYTTQTDLTPWSSPEAPDAHPSDSFQVNSSPAGGCPTSESQMPNSLSFEAGTVNPVAGTYSPFVFKLARSDGSQRIAQIDTTLPAGLVGRLAGIPYCADAAIAAASARGNPGQGALEQADPSCPLASEVGTVTVGAGSGTPYYVQGHAYLAGPYKGAPLSLEIITPAVAGPFDLGTVAVRTALYVNETTAQIHAVSDPIPSILAGIPLDIRSIALSMNRSQFTLNPTSCDPMAVLGSTTSTLGQTASLQNRFQVGGCKGLDFKPKLKIQLTGATRRVGHPALKAVLTAGPGEANIGRAQVNLPHGEFLDQGNLSQTCTRPVLLAGNCPASTVYGKAKAWTPLLEKPLEGPVYLVGGFGYKLPALVAELNGQIRVLLVGKVDSGKNHGIRNTFEAVPDAPVSRFVLEMKGGKKYGLLENSTNICKKPQEAIARFTAHNGKTYDTEPVIQVSCGKGKKKSGGKGKAR